MSKKSLYLDPGGMTILCIGAHPDDCELCCGGMATKWAREGNRVVILSITDGRSGHHILGGDEIAACRKKEAENAAKSIGAESIVLPFKDGSLEPSVENRNRVIRILREIEPDIVITNRPNDYHPDHRYTARLVQDSAYMVMVPNVVPDAPALRYNPAIFHWADDFIFPVAFRPDVIVDIDAELESKLGMLNEHSSQMYEWLPFVKDYQIPVPPDADGRKAWLREYYENLFQSSIAQTYRESLTEWYGAKGSESIQHAEAFELSQYGTRLGRSEIAKVFMV